MKENLDFDEIEKMTEEEIINAYDDNVFSGQYLGLTAEYHGRTCIYVHCNNGTRAGQTSGLIRHPSIWAETNQGGPFVCDTDNKTPDGRDGCHFQSSIQSYCGSATGNSAY